MKKTLIIHPYDSSTTFLEKIYEGMKGVTLVRGNISKSHIIYLMKKHDRIIMMGHGWGSGLFNTQEAKFQSKRGLIINSEDAEILKEKECIFIWCHAHDYVKEHKLKGFNTGMFISEVSEANWFKISTSYAEVKESNDTFAMIFKKHRHKSPEELTKKIKRQYSKLAKTNRIAKYNLARMYNGDK